MNKEIKAAAYYFYNWYSENMYEPTVLIIELSSYVPLISELARVFMSAGNSMRGLDFIVENTEYAPSIHETDKPVFKYKNGKLTREDL